VYHGEDYKCLDFGDILRQRLRMMLMMVRRRTIQCQVTNLPLQLTLQNRTLTSVVSVGGHTRLQATFPCTG